MFATRCSTLLIIREMQIKTATKYHLTPIRIAIIKKISNKKKSNPSTLLVGMYIGKAIMKNTIEVPKETEITI
jgi:hypothetical protein